MDTIETAEQAQAVLGRIDLSSFAVPLSFGAVTKPDGCCHFLVPLSITVKDRVSGAPTVVASDHTIELSLSEEQFVDAVLDRVLYMIKHEVKECFRVDGEQWEDPHIDPNVVVCHA